MLAGRQVSWKLRGVRCALPPDQTALTGCCTRTVRPLLDQTVLDQTVLDQTVLDQTVLDQTVLDQTVLDQTVLDQRAGKRPAVAETGARSHDRQPGGCLRR
jgi:hypothetical protein